MARRPRKNEFTETLLLYPAVRFFSVYSYLIVYRPEAKPLQMVAILHAHRDVAGLRRPVAGRRTRA